MPLDILTINISTIGGDHEIWAKNYHKNHTQDVSFTAAPSSAFQKTIGMQKERRPLIRIQFGMFLRLIRDSGE